MNKGLESIRDLIGPVFHVSKAGPITVYLYGSRATGNDRPDSDYDFALMARGPLGRETLEGLCDRLIDSLPGDPDVDCVDMRGIPLTLAAQVLESGIVLIPGDEDERARLENRLMSMYAILNEERQGILEDILERGSVYA